MANRYWVGGGSSTNWDATGNTNWGTASNTQDNAAVPTAVDDVFFDGVGTGASNCTLSANAPCRSLNFTGYANTFTHNTYIRLSIGDDTAGAGNIALKMVAGMTYTKGDTASSFIDFISTSATQQDVTLGGRVLGNTMFNGSGGSWIFTDTFAANGSTSTWLALQNGTLNMNGQTVNLGYFDSDYSSIRILTLGAANISLSNPSGAWDIETTTGLTFNPDTSTINMTAGGASFLGGGLTYNNLVYAAGSLSVGGGVFGANTFANLTLNGTTVKYGLLKFDADQIVTGTFTVAGNSATNRVLIQSTIGGTTRTITAAVVALTNVDFQDIIGAGAASPFTGTSLGDCLGNTNITTDAPVTRYWVAFSGGNWSATSSWSTSTGGASGASVPLPQDTAIIDNLSITSASRTIGMDMPRAASVINFTGVLNTPALSVTTVGVQYSIVYGNLTLVSGMTTKSGTYTLIFQPRSSITFVTAGITINFPVTIDGFGGTVVLSGNLILLSTRTLRVQTGTLDAATNNVDVTAGLFTLFGSYVRALLMGSGTWTANGTGMVWRLSTTTGMTLTPGTSTVVISNTTTTGKTFVGGEKIYNNLTITGDNVTISGSNTFNTLTLNNDGLTNGTKFTAGTTQTVTDFVAEGTDGNLVYIQSSSAGSTATLSQALGTVSCNYLSIKDSTATGGATWYAGRNSINMGNNSGWIFNPLSMGFTNFQNPAIA